MEESVSGFKVTGSWAEIVEHGERITEALEGPSTRWFRGTRATKAGIELEAERAIM